MFTVENNQYTGSWLAHEIEIAFIGSVRSSLRTAVPLIVLECNFLNFSSVQCHSVTIVNLNCCNITMQLWETQGNSNDKQMQQ